MSALLQNCNVSDQVTGRTRFKSSAKPLQMLRGSLLIALLSSTAAHALTEVTNFGTNPGNLSLFFYEPANLPPGAPLVVALHGCSQSAAAYAQTGWNALADQYRFAVAYPQTNVLGGCFTWFDSAQQTRNGAEVSSIVQMVQHLQATRQLSVQRTYITGLSAGGAMTAVLLATQPDVFAAGAVIAGVPFACATSAFGASTCMTVPPPLTPALWGAKVRSVSGIANFAHPRVSLWQGTTDTTVWLANQQRLIDQWTDVNGIDNTADTSVQNGSVLHREFKNGAGQVLVESWTVTAMGHGTPVDPQSGCGTAGAYVLDVGLCSSLKIAEFFGLTSTTNADAGVTDAGNSDAGAPDASVADSGAPDAGSSDAGSTDIDAGLPRDASVADGGTVVAPPMPGCGCQSVSLMPLLPLLLAVLSRRRETALHLRS